MRTRESRRSWRSGSRCGKGNNCGTAESGNRVIETPSMAISRLPFYAITRLIMSKLVTMREAISRFVPDGSSVVLGCQLEQMIPFAAGHEIMRQKLRDLRLIGPISDIL